MKTIYQSPELEILETAVDVITASGTTGVGYKQNQDETDYGNEVVDWTDVWG